MYQEMCQDYIDAQEAPTTIKDPEIKLRGERRDLTQKDQHILPRRSWMTEEGTI